MPIGRAYAGGTITAAWGDDDTIYFSGGQSGGGQGAIYRIPATGGAPELIFAPDRDRGEFAYIHPLVLPGSRILLFVVVPSSQIVDEAQIVAVELATGKRMELVPGTRPQYLRTGHLLFTNRGTLHGVRFDPHRMQILDDPMPLLEGVARANAPQITVSAGATLAYISGSAADLTNTLSGGVNASRTLVWVYRDGREEPISAPPRAYVYPRLSPDNTAVALDVRDRQNDIWVWNFERQTLQQITFDPGGDSNPIWSPDGSRIIFASAAGGPPNIFSRRADGTGRADRLTTSTNNQYPRSISPDGTHVLLIEQAPDTGNDVSVLHLHDEHPDGHGRNTVTPLRRTQASEANPELSPDGRYLAYQSNESGQNEIMVQPFPNVDDGRWLVSSGGGNRPLWRDDGRELFYTAAGGAIMAVPVRWQNTTPFGRANKLFVWPRLEEIGLGPTYDVSASGDRFLMIKEPESTAFSRDGVIVVLNWVEELNRLMTAN